MGLEGVAEGSKIGIVNLNLKGILQFFSTACYGAFRGGRPLWKSDCVSAFLKRSLATADFQGIAHRCARSDVDGVNQWTLGGARYMRESEGWCLRQLRPRKLV